MDKEKLDKLTDDMLSAIRPLVRSMTEDGKLFTLEVHLTDTRYTVEELGVLWKKHHAEIHTNTFTPCDANPGDACSVEGFLAWLACEEAGVRTWLVDQICTLSPSTEPDEYQTTLNGWWTVDLCKLYSTLE